LSNHIDIRREFAFCPILVQLLESKRAVGKSGKVFEELAALSSVNNLLTLRALMLDVRPARTLEVGFAFGASTLAFAASHRDLGHSAASQHVALDPFQETVWDSTGLAAMEAAGLCGYLDYRPASSALELPKLLTYADRFGLIYVDGSHLVENVFIDAYYVTRLLDHGGVVVFDDSSDPNVRKVLRFIRFNLSEGLREIDLIPHRTGKCNTFFYRLARRVGRTQMTAFRRIGPVEREWNAPLRNF
jgi:hypothetical protein